MSNPIDGNAIAQTIRARVRERVANSGKTPGLAAVLVGDDPASHLYVRLKERACAEVGIRFERHQFPETATTNDVRAIVRTLGARADIHGILVQLPLPPQVDADAVIVEVPPTKDVDGFHPDNLTRLEDGHPRVLPVIGKAILALLEATGTMLADARAAVLANSATFCRPVEALLHQRGIVVTRYAPFQPGTHRTEDIARADIMVSALGCGGCLDAAYVQPGAILIDVGIARLAHGAISGDFTAAAQARSSWYTPVPGGVGPVTVAMLLENVAEAATR